AQRQAEFVSQRAQAGRVGLVLCRGEPGEGVDRLVLVTGSAPDALAELPAPDAVFIGGGLGEELLTTLWRLLPAGCRVVAHAVTLESEALLAAWQARAGGSLWRIELSEAAPLGARRGWHAAYPVVQWSVTR
ncbi:MAG TPA: hypothetical protein VNV16_11545, partial [Methylibium sp.]|nr:hypothetical protein [Methylibium sp.]